MVTHEHVRFKVVAYFESNTNDDQNGCTTEGDIDSGCDRNQNRKNCYAYEEYAADKCDLGNYLGDKI